MSDKEGVTGFTASLGRFYKSDEFSDITIRCEGYEFKTHKLVLANHSPVFKKLLSGKWKVKHPMETYEGVIDIQESKLAVVDAMIFYMYNFHYNGGNHVGIREPSLVFHAEVYSIADVYDMIYLKEHAKGLFKSTLETSWDSDEFPAAVKEVYTATPAEDRGLRDVLVDMAGRNATVFSKRPDFKGELVKIPDFAADFAAHLIDLKQDTKTYKYRCSSGSSDCTSHTITLLSEMPSGMVLKCACRHVMVKV